MQLSNFSLRLGYGDRSPVLKDDFVAFVYPENTEILLCFKILIFSVKLR